MRKLDAKLIRSLLSAGPKAGLDQIEWFASIASTNTYLLGQPPPPAGRCRIAIADHQTAGRGRHFRRWVSPPGSGLCLSFAYTFSEGDNPTCPLFEVMVFSGYTLEDGRRVPIRRM